MLIFGYKSCLSVCIARLLPNGAGLQGEIGDVCVVRVAQLLCYHVWGKSPSKHILCTFTLSYLLEEITANTKQWI